LLVGGGLPMQTDRSVGTEKCYLSRPESVKSELWFAKLYKTYGGADAFVRPGSAKETKCQAPIGERLPGRMRLGLRESGLVRAVSGSIKPWRFSYE
jgi:hypothetical protein